jgi:glycosyltransferase involved in cell wall biosynthesis
MNLDSQVWWEFSIEGDGYAGQQTISVWSSSSFLEDVLLMDLLSSHFLSDQRNASLSVIGLATSRPTNEPLRCIAPFGDIIAVTNRFNDLVKPIDCKLEASEEIVRWATAIQSRGLWHSFVAMNVPTEDTFKLAMNGADLIESKDTNTPLGQFLLKDKGDKISVTIDCSWLGEFETGSQRATVEIVKELAAREEIEAIRLAALPSGLPTYASELRSLSKVNIEDSSDCFSDIYWRPYQPSEPIDLNFIRGKANRFVLTVLDLIAYDNLAYHSTKESWLWYRELFRNALLSADAITAISSDIQKQVTAAVSTLEEKRVVAARLGTDHLRGSIDRTDESRFISGIEIKRDSYIFCIGTNFAHKNRDFAIEVMKEVRITKPNCELVFAGLELNNKQSGEQFNFVETVKDHSWISALGSVSSDDRNWLYSNAICTLYPTTAEGFGFVPFESAKFDSPTVFTKFGPLAELLPTSNAAGNWTVKDYANQVLEILESSEKARNSISQIEHDSSELTWKACASDVLDAFKVALKLPPINSTPNTSFQHEIDAIKNSLSWKVTKPVRYMHRKLTGH